MRTVGTGVPDGPFFTVGTGVPDGPFFTVGADVPDRPLMDRKTAYRKMEMHFGVYKSQKICYTVYRQRILASSLA